MAVAPQPALQRRRFVVAGVVQGVGFRPFVHGLARRHGLAGFVLNTGRGVVIEAEGGGEALDSFVAALRAEAPSLARLEAVAELRMEPRGERGFAIQASDAGSAGDRAAEAGAVLPDVARAGIPADTATCDDCLRELFDRFDRRHRYPFINCTQCGPRFTIVRGVPYDRPNTTMARFEMCADCRREYEDPADRRFHAEPIACPDCGPRLSMPLEEAVGMLRDGAVLAVKGLGGWHLACDARSEEAVARLRARKHREEKPFALMAGDPWAPGGCPWAAVRIPRAADPRTLVELTPADERLLRSPERPIVLMRRRADAPVADSVAPGAPLLGVMLPYTPLHHLLLHDFGGPLVMTSGNRSDEPIAVEDEDAARRLGDIADGFLGHDRAIHRRCEDSVVRTGFPIRRSRGFAPSALRLPVAARRPLVAAGAELKSTFCVASGDRAFLSPHLGDLDSEPALRAFRADLRLYVDMLGVEPAAVARDMHPDYLSTRWADEQNLPVVEVQHHHAHAAACLAEHGETGPALALVFDGTGYGVDGTLWGGELLRCDLASFERVVHLEPVPLPGGEAAIREPWRTTAAYLERAGRPVTFEGWTLVRQSLAVNAPLSSGMGRLFDAVSALLGVRERVSYEGQAAVELEWLADGAEAAPYGCRTEEGAIAGSDLVAAAHDDLAAGRPRAEIAAAFHEGVAAAAADACEEANEPRTVVLSGGSFQNLRLLTSTRRRLEASGFRVLTHRLVPANDGGISYGQAAVAARRMM
ncbi:MAG TPA: carbamoyltransferase HypF [Thermoleophilaceae bacterium]|nr:carbamoyltransferase HypF [Thermoleophilaceae bacterium]